MPTRTDTRRLLAEEQADFVAFLATLSAQQWQAPTLCDEYGVTATVTIQ